MPNQNVSFVTPQGMVPPGVDPQTYYDLQRRQALAMEMQRQALENEQMPVGRSGPYEVQSKYPLGLGLTKLAAAIMSRRLSQQNNQTQAQLYSQMASRYAPTQPHVGPAAPPLIRNPNVDPEAETGEPVVSQATNPLNPENKDAWTVMRLATDHPDKYLEYLRGTEMQRNDLYAGIRPEERGNIMRSEALKQTQLGPGYIQATGPGQAQYVPLPGAAQAIAGQAGMTKEAETRQTPIEQVDQYGHPYKVLGSTLYGGRGGAQQGPSNPFEQPLGTPQQRPAGAPGAAATTAPQPNDPFAGAPKFTPPNTTFLPADVRKEADQVKDWKDSLFKESKATIDKAQKHTTDVVNLADAFRDSYMGPSADYKEFAAKLGTAFGLSSKDTQQKLGATQIADKLATVFGTEAARAEILGGGGSTRLTQTEWQMLLNRGAPNHKLMPYAAADILTLREAQNQYEMFEAKMKRQYAAAGYDPRVFSDEFAQRFPQSEWMKQNAPKIQTQIYQHMGLKNDNPAAGSTGTIAPGGAGGERRTIGGKSYVKINGQWHEEAR